jgi:hypothetical protein
MRLIKQKICREELFNKVLDIISSDSDIDVIKKSLVTEIGTAFKCNRCFIRIFNEKNDDFQVVDTFSEYLSSPERRFEL